MAQLHDPVRWLLLLHQIPPSPPYFRAKVVRRLSQLGALAIKNSAYILPESDETVEEFQWLRSEIGKEGGDAWLFRTETLGGVSNNELVESFRSSLDPTIASPGAIWGGGHLSSSTPSTTWASGDIQGGDSGSGKFPISPLFCPSGQFRLAEQTVNLEPEDTTPHRRSAITCVESLLIAASRRAVPPACESERTFWTTRRRSSSFSNFLRFFDSVFTKLLFSSDTIAVLVICRRGSAEKRAYALKEKESR